MKKADGNKKPTTKNTPARNKQKQKNCAEKIIPEKVTKNNPVKNKGKINTKKERKQPERELSEMQRAFCVAFVELNNETQAAIKAGYSPRGAGVQGHRLLKRPKIAEEIRRLKAPIMEKIRQETEKSIANATDVMLFLTRAMNGEVNDQFGLDPSLSDRLKAASELAKRTVDLDNRLNSVKVQGNETGGNEITIKLDWKRDDGENE